MLSRMLGIGLALSLAANAAIGLAYRQSLIKQGEIRAVAQAEAAEAANSRMADALARQRDAFERELQALRDARAREESIAREALERAEAAQRALRDFDTESRSDDTPEYAEWKDVQVPTSVVTRLRGLQ